MQRSTLERWITVIDSLSYYEILGLTRNASTDDIRKAFLAFAEHFHPDRHAWRPPEEQAHVATIFKRATEALAILCDPRLRPRYDEALAAGTVRPQRLLVAPEATRQEAPSVTPSISLAPTAVAKLVTRPTARPFAMRAAELANQGDYTQAKLQLTMAMHLDGNNPKLQAYARQIDTQIEAQKAAGPSRTPAKR